jgi:hypothetical protein
VGQKPEKSVVCGNRHTNFFPMKSVGFEVTSRKKRRKL